MKIVALKYCLTNIATPLFGHIHVPTSFDSCSSRSRNVCRAMRFHAVTRHRMNVGMQGAIDRRRSPAAVWCHSHSVCEIPPPIRIPRQLSKLISSSTVGIFSSNFQDKLVLDSAFQRTYFQTHRKNFKNRLKSLPFGLNSSTDIQCTTNFQDRLTLPCPAILPVA